MNVKEAKAKIRAEMKERIKNIKNRAEQDEIIARQALDTPYFMQANTAFIYVSTADEPDSRPIIEGAFELRKRVCVPKIIGPGKMIPVEIKSYDELVPGKYGILTAPDDAPEVDLKKIQVAIIPGVAFDKKSACRLGRGGGYYDRFVEECYSVCIGVCYDEQVVEDLPCEAHDGCMDFLFTGTRE